jgi:hypothetical protein
VKLAIRSESTRLVRSIKKTLCQAFGVGYVSRGRLLDLDVVLDSAYAFEIRDHFLGHLPEVLTPQAAV